MADRAVGCPIAREGVPFVVATGAPAVLASGFGWWWIALILGALTCFVGWFFRNPQRRVPPGQHLVVSPADGRVIAIEEEFEPRFLKSESIRMSIFLNIFDVHINRIPCTGTINGVAYQPGKFLAANRQEASLHNEQNAVMIQTPEGKKVLCVQVAGLIARRIVSWISPGEEVAQGERFGLIHFGSRVDTFVPMDSAVRVKPGDYVKGGQSILAELPCVDPS